MVTESQKKATTRYNQKNYTQVNIRIRADGDLTRERIQARADEYGLSMAQYIVGLIRKDLGM